MGGWIKRKGQGENKRRMPNVDVVGGYLNKTAVRKSGVFRETREVFPCCLLEL